MLTLPTGTETTLYPTQAEFRLLTSAGVRVVTVWLGGAMPRVSAMYLRLEEGNITEHPLSLFLDETLIYVNAALESFKSLTRVGLSWTDSGKVSSDDLAPPAHLLDGSPKTGSDHA